MKRLFSHYRSWLLFAGLICFAGAPMLHAQTTSAGATQIDPDWEKIRDAQVQMLKKKEQELDRLKEEILSRAQPQTSTSTDLLQAEFKLKEQAWLERVQKYENDISLLRVKAEDQKKEIDSLRSHSGKSGGINALSPTVPVPSGPSESALKEREVQIRAQEKTLESKDQELIRARAEFEKQLSEFDKKIKSEEDRLDGERRENLNARNALETEKRALSEDRNAISVQAQALKDSQKKFEDLQNREKAFGERETGLVLKEKTVSDKLIEAVDREKRISDSQKQLVEERRKWQVERNQLTADLEKRFAEADSRLEKADSIDLERDRIRAGYEKQLKEMRGEIQYEKDKLAQKELEWKEKTREFSQAQNNLEKQIADLKTQLLNSGKTTEQETVLKRQVEELTQRLSTAENLKKGVDAELQALKSKVDAQSNQVGEAAKLQAQIQELRDKQLALENERKAEKDAYEKTMADLRGRLADRENGFESKETELSRKLADAEQKLAEAENKRAVFESQVTELKSRPVAVAGSSVQGDVDVSGLKKEIEALRIENEDWRRSRREVEQTWSEFVNRETQYQMEIKALENQLAAASASSGGRDWSSEAKRVVEERRALSDEKSRMYRELTQERQKLEQDKVEFLRHQREFDQYIKKEQARLDRARQSVG